MMKELNQKIRALKLNGNFTYGFIYNRAIDEVLKIIESDKTNVLDEPDPECGWYYFKSHNSFPSGFYWLNSLRKYRVRTGINTFSDLSNFKGTWKKVK